MAPSRYPRRRSRSPLLRRAGRLARRPFRWLARANPLTSWLVVMAVIVGLTFIGLGRLAVAVALVWTGYAVYTWLRPSIRRRLRRW